MSNKTINQALKALFIGLGGDPSALADNSTVSDYIADLESAIKACASGSSEDLIDDTEASENKTYSSSKIESIIPEDELPSVTSEDNGKVLKVIEGEWGAASLPASGYSETTLFEGYLQGSDVATLSDSIANYNALVFVIRVADPNTGDPVEVKYPYIPTSGLIGNYYDIEFGTVNPVFAFKFTTGTSMTWLCNTNVVKIIGVKF